METVMADDLAALEARVKALEGMLAGLVSDLIENGVLDARTVIASLTRAEALSALESSSHPAGVETYRSLRQKLENWLGPGPDPTSA